MELHSNPDQRRWATPFMEKHYTGDAKAWPAHRKMGLRWNDTLPISPHREHRAVAVIIVYIKRAVSPGQPFTFVDTASGQYPT